MQVTDQVLVTAHGNSLRGIIKYLKNISDEDIVNLNLPTAVPYVFDFDEEMHLINDYFLGDPEEINKLMNAVANQGKKKRLIHIFSGNGNLLIQIYILNGV